MFPIKIKKKKLYQNNMIFSLFFAILVYLFSFFIHLSSCLISVFCFFIPSLKLKFQDRLKNSFTKAIITPNRAKNTRTLLFFCSSAGEYEQAKPLIRNWTENKQNKVFIIFMSMSGIRFAKSRSETADYFLAPLDTVFNWNKIFSKIKPDFTIVIRHEIWPCFLYTAKKFKSELILANASQSNSNRLKLLQIPLKSLLIKQFNYCCIVAEKERSFFQQQLKINPKKIMLTGDTKYDQVIERAQAIRAIDLSSNDFLTRLKIVVGSAWLEDLKLILNLITLMKKRDIKLNIDLIVLFHQPSVKNNTQLEVLSKKLNLDIIIYKKLEELTQSLSENSSPEHQEAIRIMVLDQMGCLFDVYNFCHLAFVGGACHYQVHNVLEPAAFGLPISFGPKNKNSQEAQLLLKENLATEILSAEKLLEWIISNTQSEEIYLNQRLRIRDYVKSKAGASALITQNILSPNT